MIGFPIVSVTLDLVVETGFSGTSVVETGFSGMIR